MDKEEVKVEESKKFEDNYADNIDIKEAKTNDLSKIDDEESKGEDTKLIITKSEVAILFSGGLDSTLIALYSSQILPETAR